MTRTHGQLNEDTGRVEERRVRRVREVDWPGDGRRHPVEEAQEEGDRLMGFRTRDGDRARRNLGIATPRSDGRWAGEVPPCPVCGEPALFTSKQSGPHCPPKKRKP